MYELSQGSHPTSDDGRCAMEWVSYIAGERHGDRPSCVSSVLRAFTMALNDTLEDAPRQRLRPYLARMVGTDQDGMDDLRRELIAAWIDTLPSREHPKPTDFMCGTPVLLTSFANVVQTFYITARLGPRPAPTYNLKPFTWADVVKAELTATATLPAPILDRSAQDEWDDLAMQLTWKIVARLPDHDIPESVFDLLHQMLPLCPIDIPAATDWRAVCNLEEVSA
jgi:hypothetical protein